MREIKFQAWDPNGIFNSGNPCMHEDITGLMIFDSLWHDEEFIKRQYTGLKDKDELNEIYDGDICKGHREDEDVLYEILWMPHCAKYGAKVIKSRYVLSEGLSFPLQHYIKEGTLECTFVRVGNIYENPELLK